MTDDVIQVTVFERNILGAVAVKFKREEDAEACILVTICSRCAARRVT